MRHSLLLSAILVLAASAPALSRDGARAHTRGFDSDRISVVTQGEGPDVILIHGLAAHRDIWTDAVEALKERYHLHLVQVRGFAGFAPEGNAEGPVVAPVAEEIARYIREVDLDRPAVVGHSMGGTIGMTLAARHPKILGRLLVVDSTPFLGVSFGPPGSTAESIGPIADQMRETVLTGPDDSTGMLEQMTLGMTRTETMQPVLLQYLRDSHRPTVANAFHELIVTDLRPELSRITAPVTVLYVIPPNVPISPEELESAIHHAFDNISHVHMVKIENSNHYIQIDRPDRFMAEVDAFMRR